MWVMYDSIDPSQIPASASVVGGYTSGFWPDYNEEVKRWPHAHHVSFAVDARHRADFLDVEKGDARPSEAPGWYHDEKAHGAVLPGFYMSLSPWPELTAVLEAAGIQRHQYRTLAADYTYVPHIPPGFDGCQWTDHALGRNLDESLLVDNFFGAPWGSAMNLAVLTEAEADLARSLIAYRQHPGLHHHGIRVTLAALIVKRKEVWAAATEEIEEGKPPAQAWAFRNRKLRYETLWALTG